MSVTYPAVEADPVASAAVTAEESSRASADATIQAALDTLAAAGATDVELAAAVATLNTALGTKQDASTAATDAELASAVSTINSSLAGKQDASSAATDSELAAAISTVNSAVALKQDAATAATDAELASAVATHAAATANVHGLADATRVLAFRGAWAASTAYNKNDVVTYLSGMFVANAAFTSGSTFSQSNWTQIAPCGELTTGQITSTFTTTSTAVVVVTGLSVTFTAGTRPVYLTCSASHRSSVAATSNTWQMWLDAATVLDSHIATSATANAESTSTLFARFVGTPGQTYTVQVYCKATSGATASIIAAATAPVVLRAEER